MTKQSNGDSTAAFHFSETEGVEHILPDDCVFIAGGGPVGLTLAATLSYYGIKSVILERNETTTRWPKMDLTNSRSMEYFRKLGLVDSLREQGVPSNMPYRSLFTTGVHGKLVTQWDFGTVDEWRQRIREQNDGEQPLEPWLRLSQIIFEAWLREINDKDPLIDLRFGWKVETTRETDEGIIATATDKDGKTHTFKAKYGVGCDGGSSRVRRGLGIPVVGGPSPGYSILVHFTSNDTRALHSHGIFWHNYVISKDGFIGAFISQDENDTWTIHSHYPVGMDTDHVTPEEAISRISSGNGEPLWIDVDKILVRSTYRPNLVVATQYMGPKRRLFLAGDSAHQNVPTGGYGMNMGLGDAFTLATKLEGVIHGYGGIHLLDSYQQERREVALMSVERAGYHLKIHQKMNEMLAKNGPEHLDEDSEKGEEVRRKIHEHYQTHNGENLDVGVEYGYLYHSKVIIPEDPAAEPKFDPRRYVPSTWPGLRAPHIFLRDGTAIFDLYGMHYTLVHFADGGNHGANFLVTSAEEHKVPLKHLELRGEDHARKVWQKDLVLVRPDGHVAWRGDSINTKADAVYIIEVAVGLRSVENGPPLETDLEKEKQRQPYSGTNELFVQYPDYKLAKKGEFQ
ncbi:uncharacterized protein Z520_07190 [Fonsecaea multimorphosa CBS 102226]|uniref:FAD-binding domain-containing protein n=1 Tax=Fonsecaea multimorphosa CBS 102226 TaxID=1442371 RepID=A0A0D2IJ54_9EURO|nr:uncharacterized protein Z520_07190 [Fonsecaea multimorphosa CBS 102226]KIX97076.1 hypothetical protein Z520_07190 [Fonsecaea multimorphosa CBS 102226]OAL22852.1 hypothetical protein AYO22_06760 [Fonsecaea multimorphosa]